MTASQSPLAPAALQMQLVHSHEAHVEHVPWPTSVGPVTGTLTRPLLAIFALGKARNRCAPHQQIGRSHR